ncbi:MAG: hypothetical protein AAFX85_10510 [Pseudomonadota bacterium]
MGIFEYIGVLISVIMGLAITHLAVGTTKLIQNRDTAKLYVPQLLWTVNVLLYVLMIWWSMFWWSELEQWTTYHYLGITSYAIVLFMLSATLFPYDLRADVDMEAFFFRNRVWFFGLLLLAWVLDIGETLGKDAYGLREVPPRYAIFVASMIALSITGIVSSNKRVQQSLPIAWLMLLLAYTSLATVRVIAAPLGD